MRLFNFLKGKEDVKELTKDDIINMCSEKTLQNEDISTIRIINILDIAQEMLELGKANETSYLISLTLQNRPTALIGQFLLDNKELNVNGVERFKDFLDTKEDREMFYMLYKNGLIKNSTIGEIDEKTQEKIDLAFDEGMALERDRYISILENNSVTTSVSLNEFDNELKDDFQEIPNIELDMDYLEL